MDHHLYLSWHNITVQVTEKKYSFWGTATKKKTILFDVTGSAHENCIVAIIGASGGGKTTFLGAISGRLKKKSGTLKVNSTTVSDDYVKNVSSYIQQQDIFTETLTVMEHMQFMTALQLAHKTKYEQLTLANKLLMELGLNSHKLTVIRNLSGGEKRRLSLAGALINDPLILFCDEPTTGLDSYSATNVVDKLQNLANSGKIILVTIHQPSSQIFSNFDKLVLLAGGRLIFEGTKDQANLFFLRYGLCCPVSYNLADFYMKCITIPPGEEELYERKIGRMARDFKQGAKCDAFVRRPNGFRDLMPLRKVPNPFTYQLKWLIWRDFINLKRNANHYLAGYLILMSTGLLLSLGFAFVKITDSSSIQNIQGLLVLIMSELIFTNMYAVIFIFPSDLAVFLGEKSLYSTQSYFISKVLSMVPLVLIRSMSYVIMFFLVVHVLSGFWLFLQFSLILFISAFIGSTIGLSFSATFPTVEHAELLLTVVETIMLAVSGLWLRIDSLPFVFGLMKYLSPFFYGFQSLSVAYWRNIDYLGNCTETLPCYTSGNEVLVTYGFLKNYDLVLFDIICMIVLSVFYCVLGFLGIVRKRIMYNMY